ncbi:MULTISPECIES: OmpH family outer membrane protein [unclassified Pseudodesulfovibrio]|uniref:OmpH family outer membrane protein n=1 Tax=unclassified Pseudodesulfovibrio TaxID=2661612 RepID=UPI000FEC058D|nr:MULTISPECIES: OmpH family outer membrane protein [unclassified Pseudodesulfovibrio]MCJ2163990.1 OmpH family outer membrane protein [Pseudodesulfovibrio sp. S3-i]RWU05370.1 OmpH family outer membrane protein [Pseudodesulfovibrio sp. S3]
MKKVCLFAVCFVFLFQAVAFAETKIAVFNTQKIIQDSAYGKEVRAKLDAKFNARGNQLKKEREDLEKLKTQIDSKAFEGKTLQDKVTDLRRRGRDWNEDYSVYQKAIQAEQNELGKPILLKLEKVVMDYCTTHGYTIAFDKQTPGLAFMADGLDITDDLVKALDKLKQSGK